MTGRVRGLYRPLGLPAPPGCWFWSPPPSPVCSCPSVLGVPLPGSLPQLQTGATGRVRAAAAAGGGGALYSHVVREACARGQDVPACTRGCASAGSMGPTGAPAPCPPTSPRGRASSPAASRPRSQCPQRVSPRPLSRAFSRAPSPHLLPVLQHPPPGSRGLLLAQSLPPQHNSHNRRTFQKIPCVLGVQTGQG